MNKAQAHLYINALPADTDDLVIWRSKIAKRRRLEKDRILSFRLPETQKSLFLDTLERIGEHIGSQARAEQVDWLLAVCRQELER